MMNVRLPLTRTLTRLSRLTVPALGALCAITVTAAAEDFEFTPIDEIPEGRGLVSDGDGDFTIFKWDRSKKQDPLRETEAPTLKPEKPVTSSGITEAVTPE